MKKYFAKANIGIFGQGLVTFGEILNEKQLTALGHERVQELVRDGALGIQEDAPPAAPKDEPPKPESEAEPQETDQEQETPPDTGEEMPDLGISPDDLMGHDTRPEEDKPGKGGRGKKT